MQQVIISTPEFHQDTLVCLHRGQRILEVNTCQHVAVITITILISEVS